MNVAIHFLVVLVVLICINFSRVSSMDLSPEQLSWLRMMKRGVTPDMWECAPDPAIELFPFIHRNSYNWHLLSKENQHRVLSHLGAPFLIDLSDEWKLACLLDVVALLNEDNPMCIRYSPISLQEVFFLLYPEQRSIWYDTVRLRELSFYLGLASEWKLMRENKFYDSPKRQQAEQKIVSFPKEEAQGPAVLPIVLFFVVHNYISLSDITLQWKKDQPHHPGLGELPTLDLPALQLNLFRGIERRGEQLRLQQKFHYQKEVEELNAIVKKATHAFSYVIASAIKKSTSQTIRDERRREMLRRLRADREKLRSREMQDEKTIHEYITRKHAKDSANEQRQHHQITCYHLYRVSQTLHTPYASHALTNALHESGDRRAIFYNLLKKYHCTEMVHVKERMRVEGTQENKDEREGQRNALEVPVMFDEFVQYWNVEKVLWTEVAKSKEIDKSASHIEKLKTSPHFLTSSSLLCEHIQQFYAWSQETGYVHTVSQSFTLFYALFVLHHPENAYFFSSEAIKQNIKLSISALIRNVLPFQPNDFVTFTGDLLQHASYLHQLESHCPKVLPFPVQAELWYFFSSLELFQSRREDDGVMQALGVLHLYQAVWYGSRPAASAMATYREHGIFVAQHEKVAARLLYLFTLDNPNDILFQLLRRYIKSDTNTFYTSWCPDNDFSNLFVMQRSTLTTEPHEQKVIHYSSSRVRSTSVLRNSTGSGTLTSIDNPFIMSRLLRYSRFMDKLNNPWYSVDQPHVNSKILKDFVSLEVDNENEEEEENDPEMLAKSEIYFFQAMILFSGLHGIPRNLKRVECLLLTILRERGFYCDISRSLHQVFIQRSWDDICKVHSKMLNLDNPSVPCGWKNVKELPKAFDESAYDILQKSLSWLSFLYMIEEKPELSSFYAMLAVDLSRTVYFSASAIVENQLHLMNRTASKNMSRSSDIPWYAAKLMTEEKEGVIPPFTSSFSFSSRQPLFFMAMAKLLASVDPQKSCVVDAIEQETFSLGFDAWEKSKYENGVGGAENEAFPRPLSQLFVLLLSAAGEKKAMGSKKNRHENYEHLNAVEGVDPFFVLIWLIQRISSLEEGERWSPSVILQQSVSYLSVLGDAGEALLPRPWESWIAFGCRLSDEAYRIKQLGRVNLAFQLELDCRTAQLSPSRESKGYLFLRKLSRSVIPRLRVETRYQTRLPRLKPTLIANDLDMYLRGSGYSSFAKVWDAVVNKLYFFFTKTTVESLLDQFEKTVLPSRMIVKNNALSLSPVTSVPFSSQDLLSDTFRFSGEVRRFASGLFLFNSAMEIGCSQSFSLLLYAADEGGNSYVRPFATSLARDVWGGSTVVSLWREEHLLAQWQEEKPKGKAKGLSYAFSLDTHLPFYYATQETRQELMFRINLWSAKMRFVEWKNSLASEKGVDVSTLDNTNLFKQHEAKQNQRKSEGLTSNSSSEDVLQLIKKELLLCTSYLQYLDAVKEETIENDVREHSDVIVEHQIAPHSPRGIISPYAGMVFPAAATSCVEELLLERIVRLTPDERDLYTAYLQDLVERNLLFYKIGKMEKEKTKERKQKSNESRCDFADVVERVEDGEAETPYFLVEPWHRSDLKSAPSIDLGEGVFFNRRLHRLSGTKWAVKILQWRNKFWKLFNLWYQTIPKKEKKVSS